MNRSITAIVALVCAAILFIGVNVIYNRYWPLFTEYIGGNLNPFCSQVLAGNPRSAVSMKAKIVRLRNRYMPGLRPLRD